jgi:DNA-binding NtrC family response regulator
MKRNTILVVDDEELIRISLSKALANAGYLVLEAETGMKAWTLLKEKPIDLVILDLIMPEMGGFELLKHLKGELQDIQVMVITAFSSIETAIESIKLGAFDYLSKPFNLDEVIIKVGKALENRKLRNSLRKFRTVQEIELKKYKIIYQSQKMAEVIDRIKKVVDSNLNTVLITGDTGTGKELAARAIHLLSSRSDQPFIALNCNAVPSNLLESELFGYEKGAFTNAFESRKGMVEQAESGTLFLDEIGDMDVNLQGKLLRFLEDRIIRKIGGRKEIETDVILLSSTNKDLHKAVAEGRFRADLFHRINLVNIHLPPLRERKEDIPVLTEYFLSKYRRKHGKEVKGFTAEAMNILTDYYWPGNVRELRNFIEQILIFEGNIEVISPETILRNLQLIQPQTTGIDPFLIEQLLFQRDFTYDNIVRDFSKKLLKRALELSNNNRVKAAKLLKIDRSTLNYQIRILGIEP